MTHTTNLDMRRLLFLTLPTLALGASAHAALLVFDTGFAHGGVIPDGDPNGWQDTRTVTGIPSGSTIADLNVTLSLAGGFNGDLYGHLVYSTGFAVLLNRTGRTDGDPAGYADPGFQVTFDDAPGNHDIHLYQTLTPSYGADGQVLGVWQTDARTTYPLTALDTDPRTATLLAFNNLDPNGDWTLFLADVSSGEQCTVKSWGLQIEVVPEISPLVPALLLLSGALLRRLRIAHP